MEIEKELLMLKLKGFKLGCSIELKTATDISVWFSHDPPEMGDLSPGGIFDKTYSTTNDLDSAVMKAIEKMKSHGY